MPSREEIAGWLREVEQEYKQLASDIKGPFNEPILKTQIKWGKRAAQVENMRCENCNSKDELLKEMARAIHYPRCWDTMAYPTLADAVIEVYKSFRCERSGCH